MGMGGFARNQISHWWASFVLRHVTFFCNAWEDDMYEPCFLRFRPKKNTIAKGWPLPLPKSTGVFLRRPLCLVQSIYGSGVMKPLWREATKPLDPPPRSGLKPLCPFPSEAGPERTKAEKGRASVSELAMAVSGSRPAK